MKWFRATITRKFLLLLFGFFVLQLLQLGVGVYSMLPAEQRSAAIDPALLNAAIVGLTLALGVVGIWLVRRIIVRPLQRTIEGARAIADGAYDRKIDLRSYDEFRELALTMNRMASAIDNKTARLHALNEVALIVTSSLALKEILEQIMLYGMPLCGAQAVCMAFYDDATQRLQEPVTRGLSDNYVANMTFPRRGLGDEVMRRGGYLVSSDVPGASYPLPAETRAEGIRSILCLPLEEEQRRLGVIYFYRSDRNTFDFEEIELIRTFSVLAAHAIQNARRHAAMVGLAETDALTGLYNRRKLEQRLHEEVTRAQRLGHPLTLLALDIDRFKSINDAHGHAAGDAVLKALASVFKREVRSIDLVARLGGEEFMFVLPETDAQAALRVAERIREAVAANSITLADGASLQISASLGISSYPQTADGVEKLMTTADRAMYAAKQAGRNRTVLYSG